jgi:hypothetical protein
MAKHVSAYPGTDAFGDMHGDKPRSFALPFDMDPKKLVESGWGISARHGLTPGSIDPEIVPYYLLLIGAPDQIPFEFQYLLGVDYAIGRLSFDAPEDYERYARSTVAYESARSVCRAQRRDETGCLEGLRRR